MSTVAPAQAQADEQQIEAFAERLLGDTVTFSEYLSMWLGLELGLYTAMHEHGPATPGQLADRAGIAPRYAREWLEQQTVAGFLGCSDPSADADARVFHLPPAVAAVLLDEKSGAYLGPLVSMVKGVTSVLGPLVDAYRSGRGVRYSDYGADVRHGIGGLNGPTFDGQMHDWLAHLPDIDDRLRTTDAHILDMGCGIGRSTIALARAYPRATVRGIDLDPASIDDARAAAAAAGLANRVTFTCTDAAEIADDGTRYDLVTIFEALHDMGDPVGALRSARALLADGGAVYLVDEKVADRFAPDVDIVERLQYGFSVLHCLPATLAEDPEVAAGTVLRMPTVVEWAQAAGLDRVEDLQIEDLFWRHYRLSVEPAPHG